MNPKHALILGLVIGALLMACYLKLHYSCPSCHNRGQALKRMIAQWAGTWAPRWAEP